MRVLLKAFLAILIQQRLLIDQTGKQNLLAYATDERLDHLGILVGVERLQASRAVTTVEVKLSAERAQATVIKKGTRVTADNTIFFALDDDLIFSAGQTSKTCAATCTQTGEAGNGYLAGELNRVVDPQAFLLSIVNTTTSEGGADIETDDALRERIQLAPESFSCAGSELAYKFHAMSVNALISDVFVTSPQPGYVDCYVLLKGGNLPNTELLNAVANHLNEKTVRPLTDFVTVKRPGVLNYNLNVSYWISQDDSINAAQITAAAESAVQDYVEWQRQILGRDLNPDELIYRLKSAGVKRVVVTSPAYTAIGAGVVAIPNQINVTFAGLEDN